MRRGGVWLTRKESIPLMLFDFLGNRGSGGVCPRGHEDAKQYGSWQEWKGKESITKALIFIVLFCHALSVK